MGASLAMLTHPVGEQSAELGLAGDSVGSSGRKAGSQLLGI